MPQRCTLVSMEEMRIEGGGDFPHVKKGYLLILTFMLLVPFGFNYKL